MCLIEIHVRSAYIYMYTHVQLGSFSSLSWQDLKSRNEVILEAKARLEDELENVQSKASLVGEWCVAPVVRDSVVWDACCQWVLHLLYSYFQRLSETRTLH